ncbi:uncharacterized protein EHS24_003461 [Apiotrichum porosum]|uniref:Uncharacterized protein n=1 Tax=Apiotrichum porosum TaxID=105984 RepID=A0A427XFI9_9TREE|nr:uncharacterized protein EHS24_003461 [Apiotrichum porosum]RSH77484.1 hypothetical protein EHS24_003461 [Apiotrichum porosum]
MTAVRPRKHPSAGRSARATADEPMDIDPSDSASPPVSPLAGSADASAMFDKLLADLDAKSTYKGYRPKTKRECFTRYVFPGPPVPGFTLPLNLSTAALPPPPKRLAGADVEQAHARLRTRTPGTATAYRLSVQYHAGIHTMLCEQVKRIHAEHPYGDTTPLSPADRQSQQIDAMAVAEWVHSAAKLQKSAGTRSPDELVASTDALNHLGDPLNTFLADKIHFTPGSSPPKHTRWAWPPTKDASDRTDWVCYSNGAKRGILKWKHAVTDYDMASVHAAASGPATRVAGGNWPLDVHPGFEIWYDADHGRVLNDGRVSENGVDACLLAWSDSHHYRTRWSVLFNGRTALVTYLAKPDTLFVTELIGCEDGKHTDALTIALVLFAIATLDRTARPTVSMMTEAIKWHPKPARMPQFVVDGSGGDK